MNVFTLSFDTRLAEWYDLRKSLQESDLENICIEVDKFWQQCPLNNYYLHPHDIKDWPNPWQLLHDNTYCYYSRGLGIVYTLLLLGIKDVDFFSAKDYNEVDVVLATVDNAKYVMNYWPNSVVNTELSDFSNIRNISVDYLKNKIGQ
jgi:hypothetical protein